MSATAKSALRKAGLFYFVWVMFSYCTGGPFGLEDMVTTSGPGMTLIFLLVIPFFWCIPVSLVSAELTTAMPVEGGFYRWVRAGFGDFWGFLAGWWNWSASFLLGSVYAVQFADYLGYYFPDLIGWRHWLVSLAMVAVITYINVRGIQMVGKFATVLELFILLPVLVLVVIGLAKWHHNPFVPVSPSASAAIQNVWRRTGARTVALFRIRAMLHGRGRSGESAPQLSPRSGAGRAHVDRSVLSATLASLAALGNWERLAHRIFLHRRPTHRRPLARRLDDLAAMITQVSLLNGTILASTRMPFAMAEDGYLPHALAGTHPPLRHALDCDHHFFRRLWPAGHTFPAATDCHLQLVARRHNRHDGSGRMATPPKKPDMPRPFVIPGGRAGLFYSVVAVIVMSAVALMGSDRYGLIWGPVALAVGPVVYFAVRRGGTSVRSDRRDAIGKIHVGTAALSRPAALRTL